MLHIYFQFSSCVLSQSLKLSCDQTQLIATMGLLQNVFKKCQTTSPPNDFKYNSRDCSISSSRRLLEGQVFSWQFKISKSRESEDNSTIWETEDVENVLVNCSGKHLHRAGNASHAENPVGSLLRISSLS